MKLNKLGMVLLLLLPAILSGSTAGTSDAGVLDAGISDDGMLYLSAALAVGLSAIAGGIAVGLVGAAAMGAVSEKPEISGRALIFLGLAEGIAIYGFIIAIMILGKLD